MPADPAKILIVDDEKLLAEGCRRLLQLAGYDATAVFTPEEGLRLAADRSFAIILVDYQMPGMTGLEFIAEARQIQPAADLVLMTGNASIDVAVEAMKRGAQDYLAKPFEPDKLLEMVARLQQRRGSLGPKPASGLLFTFNRQPVQIIGASPVMEELFALLLKAAPSESTLLIEGESGTGKELFARALHAFSRRKNRPFIAMDTGALVESLFESELFGHVKGSFTGAIATKHGAFELANGGTFFFDEIGNISLNIQAKLLRAIQEKEIRRIGSTQSIAVNVRVIAATNRELRTAVAAGEFREDLYYRLSVIPIRLPSLRERRDDIPLLLDHFIKKHNLRRRHQPIERVSEAVRELFQRYPWPGNIRELENVIERAAVIEEGREIDLRSLPPHLQSWSASDRDGEANDEGSLAEMEKRHILHSLQKHDYNISRCAKTLGIDRKTLYDKIRKYQIQLP